MPSFNQLPAGSHTGAVLIIPALDEEAVIGATLASIPSGLFESVIVADNGSTDSTARIASAHGATVVRETERGYGAACLRALQSVPSSCSIVVFMQADSSEDPAEAAALLAPILDGRADFVLGSRVLGQADAGAILPHQAFGNWLATALIRLLWHHTYTDLGPFRAIRLDLLRQLDMRDRNFGWTIEMQIKALRHRLRILEIPVRYKVRAAGENKVSGNLAASVRAAIKIFAVIGRLYLRP
ncbi:MAG: glycosyltransferase family 2 protein [Bryobacteraceae bacterium]